MTNTIKYILGTLEAYPRTQAAQPACGPEELNFCHLKLQDSSITDFPQKKHPRENKWWSVIATVTLQMPTVHVSCTVFLKNSNLKHVYLYRDHGNPYAEMVNHHRSCSDSSVMVTQLSPLLVTF